MVIAEQYAISSYTLPYINCYTMFLLIHTKTSADRRIHVQILSEVDERIPRCRQINRPFTCIFKCTWGVQVKEDRRNCYNVNRQGQESYSIKIYCIVLRCDGLYCYGVGHCQTNLIFVWQKYKDMLHQNQIRVYMCVINIHREKYFPTKHPEIKIYCILIPIWIVKCMVDREHDTLITMTAYYDES